LQEAAVVQGKAVQEVMVVQGKAVQEVPVRLISTMCPRREGAPVVEALTRTA